jgi:hypothetical protein
MMAQPQPPNTRQSGPQAKPASKDPLHLIKPGGPIKPSKMGFINPGPTDNLRGVEPNTAMHRGTPNPDQHGSHGHVGGVDHAPGINSDVHGHGVPTFTKPVPGRHSSVSAQVPTPTPGDDK